ncbi:hypothetical protein NQZ68_007096 [Dissostichus eleginoides]|nr:hypothetical protein NQZ68_007096 [Dissostichus eleginoides]
MDRLLVEPQLHIRTIPGNLSTCGERGVLLAVLSLQVAFSGFPEPELNSRARCLKAFVHSIRAALPKALRKRPPHVHFKGLRLSGSRCVSSGVRHRVGRAGGGSKAESLQAGLCVVPQWACNQWLFTAVIPNLTDA